ncbi:DUF305 domain-containing protein [Actinorugispora endophytica]|uniref:Uncharacterized protein (DUF305 family) n=1 Tax=Actinorugispora endophytica TaxID=1605990 RepID=A0A4R6V486_9ACTN|nr:DUF305 domain-containing protein [Actinorugispora endophytica]TDQ53662.1 uncharacterized protein (DUF305 family) [Actinorugispora endophytica]
MGNEGDDRDVTAAPPRTPRGVPLPIAAFLVILALVGGFLANRPGHPLDSSADAGFLRDMSAHHAQAVDMAMIAYDGSDESVLKTVSYDIARTQQAQIGRMQGWLVLWGLGARGTQPPMAWMAGHGHGGGGEVPDRMPGLATDEQMDALEAASGVEAEILFLELMIEHHKGGIEMARAAVDTASEDVVVDFARGMVTAQQSEIDLMNDMLVERGAEPVDD